jgi:tRNA threonylcarbamoyladenosine biosynthesis protein TsaB
MILIIDTTDRNIIKLGLVNEKSDKGIEWFEKETDKQSEDLLIFIDSILKDRGLKLNNIKVILVNIGPGSFTGVRVGVTVANTLSWSLNIPVFGYRNDEIKIAVDNLKNIRNKKFSKIVLPYYTQKLV